MWRGARSVQRLGVQPDQIVLVADGQVTQARYGPILAVWEGRRRAPLYLVSHLDDAEADVAWYRLRAQIETFFSDQTSCGFHIDKRHLSNPVRRTRVLLAAGLVYLWMIYVGAIARRDGWDAMIHRADRCDWILFQPGMHLRDHWLHEGWRITVAFCPPPPPSTIA